MTHLKLRAIAALDNSISGKRRVSDQILVHDHGEWCELVLHRPERLNSFTDEMHHALRAAIEDARDTRKRAILLTGAGRAFCAGQDLSERDPAQLGGPPDLEHTLTEYYNPLIRLIRSLKFPVICAVNGVAAGAGANLALACDLVLAATSARFIEAFARIGLVPDAGGSWMLPRLIGEARAKALALTGDPITADEAAAWGLIWKTVEDDRLMAEARALTARLAQGPTVGLGHTKQLIQIAASRTLDEQLDLEARTQKICGETSDYAEGVSAFLEKRNARFTGSRS